MNRDAAEESRIMTATFTKETAESKTGVAVGEQNGKIVISNIVPGSLAAENTELRRGLVVISINDKEMEQGMTSNDAAKLLIDAVGDVTIKVMEPAKDAGGSATAPSGEPEKSSSSSSFWCCD